MLKHFAYVFRTIVATNRFWFPLYSKTGSKLRMILADGLWIFSFCPFSAPFLKVRSGHFGLNLGVRRSFGYYFVCDRRHWMERFR